MNSVFAVAFFVVLVIYACQLLLAGFGVAANPRSILLGIIVLLLAIGFAMAFGLFGGSPVIRLGG